MNQTLYTKQGEALTGMPWAEYPRPAMVRQSFICLNGEWDFATVRASDGVALAEYTERIRVPFAPESALSGIGRTFPNDTALWYRKRFSIENPTDGGRVLLHFGAVDRDAEVFLNGTRVGDHTGGYHPFSFDVTELLVEGENELTVCATDPQDDPKSIYGKQKRRRGGMWYTPVSGIWQTIWMECVPREYIRTLTVVSYADHAELTVTGVTNGTVRIRLGAGEVSIPLQNGRARLEVPDPQPWSPEDPYLYRFTVESGEDHVDSYFALREIGISSVEGIPRLTLNGKPYFFKGLLDQGYYSDGIYTPASPDCFTEDILAAKRMGFNTLRKHIKIEPQIFYYECDRLGIAVFQDMVSGGTYSFLRDTALPTVGIQKRKDHRMNRDPEYRARFLSEMEETVRLLSFHPSICYWTIFNEGWGQFESSKAYDRLRSIDSTRPIDTTSGWFRGGKTDVESLHIYFRKPRIKPSPRPVVISEFGGFTCRIEGHCFSDGKTYGYGACATTADLTAALDRLWREDVEPLIPLGLCAAIYTQLSDVEEEVNGLLTYDRRVCKVERNGVESN